VEQKPQVKLVLAIGKLLKTIHQHIDIIRQGELDKLELHLLVTR
jgi:hypothetical protein